MNTTVDSTESEDSESFDGQYALLEAKGCSIDVLRRYAGNGTRAEQAALSRNPDLPEDLRATLTADHFLQRDQMALEEIASRQDDEVVRNFVNMYAGTTRPFCTPRFLPFDRENPQHRVADQVFCGFPFTSAEFPWPVEKLGNHMQPIAQINLATASDLLGVKLGSGLLQLWGGIDSFEKVELQSRLVPESALSSGLDWFYPVQTPWLDRSSSFEGCAHSAIEPMDFHPFGVDCCRIEWHKPQRMFYPTIGKRVFDVWIPQLANQTYLEMERE